MPPPSQTIAKQAGPGVRSWYFDSRATCSILMAGEEEALRAHVAAELAP